MKTKTPKWDYKLNCSAVDGVCIDSFTTVLDASDDPEVYTMLDPSLDTDGDGTITRKELFDLDNDGDTDIHDVVKVVTNDIQD